MRLAVEGLGVVGTFGLGADALRHALDTPVLPRQADVAELGRFFSKRDLRRVSHFCRLGLLGASLAVEDGGLSAADRERLGLVLATGHGPVATTFEFLYSIYEFGTKLASPTAFSTSIHNVAASTISIMSGYTGPSLTVTQFALSWASSLLTAYCWLAEGRVDKVLVGAVDEYNPVLEQAARLAGCPLRHNEGAVFVVLSAKETSRYGMITEVSMGRHNPPDSSTHVPFELAAGPAFSMAAGLTGAPAATTYVDVDDAGGWSVIAMEKSVS